LKRILSPQIPAESQKSLLDLIANKFSLLPPWIGLFVSSRDEPVIRKRLERFKPVELLADEQRNREDVRAFLREVGRKKKKKTNLQ
jgi:hypothetical protein